MSSRAWTNWLGVAVLVVFAVVVVQQIKEQNDKRDKEISQTRVILNKLADGFAVGNEARMNSFVPGEVLDFWGNPIELRNADTVDWVFMSAGPDGEWGTKDDLRNAPVNESNKNFGQNNRDSWTKRMKDKLEKVKQAKEAVKDAVDKVKDITRKDSEK